MYNPHENYYQSKTLIAFVAAAASHSRVAVALLFSSFCYTLHLYGVFAVGKGVFSTSTFQLCWIRMV